MLRSKVLVGTVSHWHKLEFCIATAYNGTSQMHVYFVLCKNVHTPSNVPYERALQHYRRGQLGASGRRGGGGGGGRRAWLGLKQRLIRGSILEEPRAHDSEPSCLGVIQRICYQCQRPIALLGALAASWKCLVLQRKSHACTV